MEFGITKRSIYYEASVVDGNFSIGTGLLDDTELLEFINDILLECSGAVYLLGYTEESDELDAVVSKLQEQKDMEPL